MQTQLPPLKMEHPTTEEEAFEWYMPNLPDYKPEQWVINELNMRIEYALRHLVKPTIKKEITRGKIRWRGIYVHTLVCESSEVYNVRLSGEGKLTDIQYTGHALKLPGVTYHYELRLFQRDHESRKTVNMLVQGNDIHDALKHLNSKLTSYDCEIISIKKSPILDILKPESAE